MRMAGAQRLSTTDTVNGAVVFLITGAVMLVGFGAAMEVRTAAVSFGTVLFGGFVVILVHELGHAIAAWAVGWRVWIIHVAPFSWRMRPASLRFVGGYGGPDVGGFVLASPASPRHDTKLRDCVVSAGGPLASWIMAGTLLAIALPGPIGRYDVSDLRYVLYALALFSLAGAIASTLPLYGRGRGNDGARIQARLDGVLKPIPHAAWARVLWRYGVEPHAWDETLRGSVERARQNPALAHVPAYFDFVAALRAQDETAARKTFAAFEASTDDATTPILEAYVRAAFENNAACAVEILEAATPTPETPREVLAVRELALAETERLKGDAKAARARLSNLRSELHKHGLHRQPIWDDLIGAADTRLNAAT